MYEFRASRETLLHPTLRSNENYHQGVNSIMDSDTCNAALGHPGGASRSESYRVHNNGSDTKKNSDTAEEETESFSAHPILRTSPPPQHTSNCGVFLLQLAKAHTLLDKHLETIQRHYTAIFYFNGWRVFGPVPPPAPGRYLLRVKKRTLSKSRARLHIVEKPGLDYPRPPSAISAS